MRSRLLPAGAKLKHLLTGPAPTSGIPKGNGCPLDTGVRVAQASQIATSSGIQRNSANQQLPEVTLTTPAVSSSPRLASYKTSSLQKTSFAGHGDRGYATEAANGGGNIHVKIPITYSLHMLEDEGPSQEALTTKKELMDMYRHMTVVRRMEITADMLFKSQFVRGFCHLYDGQEAVSVGMEAALTYEDCVLTAYRDHGNYIGRGGTVFEAFSEMMGKRTGAAFGKGGSMHLYKLENNFYGGWGIVGSPIPLGTGLAFANKYQKTNKVTVTIYGDGAANQGQLFEAQNMAALWNLPVIYLVENNHYGMGTAEWRASKKPSFFDRTTYIPGIKVDGMDVFSVKNAFAYAKEFCLTGKGPIVLEADTYRYHGHSMSDPGKSYRDRSEIQGMRQSRDPIEHLRKIILEENISTPEELKSIDKQIRQEVEDASTKAKEAPLPEDAELFSNIYKLDTGLVTYGCDRAVKVQLP